MAMEKDPHGEVASLSKTLTEYIRNKVSRIFKNLYCTFHKHSRLVFLTIPKAKDLWIARDGENTRTYTYSGSSNDSMDRSMLAS